MVGIRYDGQVLARKNDEFYWSDDQNAVDFCSIEAAINFIENILIPENDGDIPNVEVFFSYWWYIEHNQ